MTIHQALANATTQLRLAGIDSPALDANVLLAYTLSLPHETLLTRANMKLRPASERRFFSFINRRKKHELVAYLTRHKAFYDLDFLVNPATLIPRPETETLIEAVLENPADIIIDVGTGSGAIAVTLAKHLPESTVYATEISPKAILTARKNANRNEVTVLFKKGNLLDPFRKLLKNTHQSVAIVANLPYVPTKEWKTLQPEITKYEPRNAVDGGRDGLKYYKELLKQLQVSFPRKRESSSTWIPGSRIRSPEDDIHKITLFLEFDPEQTSIIKKLVKKYFPASMIEIKKDLAKRNRVLIAMV